MYKKKNRIKWGGGGLRGALEMNNTVTFCLQEYSIFFLHNGVYISIGKRVTRIFSVVYMISTHIHILSKWTND